MRGLPADVGEALAHRLQGPLRLRDEVRLDPDLLNYLVHPPLRQEPLLRPEGRQGHPPGPRVGAPALDQALLLKLAHLEGDAGGGDDDPVADLPLGEGAVLEHVEDVEGHRREAERLEDPVSRGLDGAGGRDNLVDERLHALCWATTLRRGLSISLAGVIVVLCTGMFPRNQARQNHKGASGFLCMRCSKVSISPIDWWVPAQTTSWTNLEQKVFRDS